MNKVQVLIEGYARTLPDETEEASSCVTLITTQSGGHIIVDPGSNRELLLQKLNEQGLKVEGVKTVFFNAPPRRPFPKRWVVFRSANH